jgi:cell division septation protein DedD
MTESPLREIQLTGKKLVFVFMSALLVAVVVFLLGVWVGRGIGDPAASGVAAAGSSAAGDTQVAANAGAEPGKLNYPNVLQGNPPAAPPVQAPPPNPKPETSKPQTPPAATGGWVVQLGAFGSKANADGLAARLKAKNHAAYVISLPVGPQFKVRVGPFANEAEARQAAARLSKEPGVTKPSVINTR